MFKTMFKKTIVLLLIMSIFCATQGMGVFAEALGDVKIEASEQISKSVDENNDNIADLQETISVDKEEIVEDSNISFIGKDTGLKKEELDEDIESSTIIEEDVDNTDTDTIDNVFATSNNRAITLDDFGKTLYEGSYYLESDVRADINKSDNSFISINGIVEIDLNGYTLSGYKGSPVIMVNDGELTIKNGRVIAYDCYAISLTDRSSKIKVESGEYYTISRFSSNTFPKCISVTFDTNDMIIEEGYFSDLQFETVYTQYNFEYIKQSVVTVKEGSTVVKERRVCGKDELTGKDLVANYIITKESANENEENETVIEETTVEETTEETTAEETIEETTIEEITTEVATEESTTEVATEETTIETTTESNTTIEENEVRVITEDDFGKTLTTGKYILEKNVTSAAGSIFTDGDVEIDLQGWTLTGNKSWFSTIEVSGGTLAIKNGDVVSNNGGYAICVCDNAKVVVEDGHYYSTYNYESVYGGTKGYVELNGGSFVAMPDRYSLQEGLYLNNKTTTHNGRKYYYTVEEKKELDDVVENLSEIRVITEADFGNTLTTGVYKLEDNIKSNAGSIFTEGDVVIDLNGYTLTGSKSWHSVIEVTNGTLTIKNGEIFSQNGGYAICVCEGAKAIIEDGYYYATYYYESVYGGTNTEIEIRSGSFSKLPKEYILQDGASLTSKWALHNMKIYTLVIE